MTMTSLNGTWLMHGATNAGTYNYNTAECMIYIAIADNIFPYMELQGLSSTNQSVWTLNWKHE